LYECKQKIRGGKRVRATRFGPTRKERGIEQAGLPAKTMQTEIGNLLRHRVGWQASKLIHHFLILFIFCNFCFVLDLFIWFQ